MNSLYKQNQIRITPNDELMAVVKEKAKKKSLPFSTYARVCLVEYLKNQGVKFNDN